MSIRDRGWSVAEARQRLPELLRLAAELPQPIYRRDVLAAVLVSADEYAEFKRWREGARPASELNIGAALAHFRSILAEEEVTLDFGRRQDRDYRFVPEE